MAVLPRVVIEFVMTLGQRKPTEPHWAAAAPSNSNRGKFLATHLGKTTHREADNGNRRWTTGEARRISGQTTMRFRHWGHLESRQVLKDTCACPPVSLNATRRPV